jgi:hypothetical protein
MLRLHISTHFISAHVTYQHTLFLPVFFPEKDKSIRPQPYRNLLLQVLATDFVRVAKMDLRVQLTPPLTIYLNDMKDLFLGKQLREKDIMTRKIYA